MAESTRVVSSAILGVDSESIVISGKRYEIPPPTIHRIAGAAYYLSGIQDGQSMKDIISSINDAWKVACALSFFISGDTSLAEELSAATLDEAVDGIEKAYSLISAQNFMKLSALAKSVANLTAKPKL